MTTEKLFERNKGIEAAAAHMGSYSELARAIGVSPARVGNWARGSEMPSDEYVIKIFNLTSVDRLLIKPSLGKVFTGAFINECA